TGDMLLYSEFESKEALAAYQTDPLHVAAATYVRSIVCDRACADFEC
ncbi:MAG: Dabb family protein, partial [Clostridia bacterium]|nr:Dabb family protein [Clostridia bacterium]